MRQYNRHMDELERRIARAAIEAPPAESPEKLATAIAHAVDVDPAKVEMLVESLCDREVLVVNSAHAGNLAAGELDSTLVKIYFDKGPRWHSYMISQT